MGLKNTNLVSPQGKNDINVFKFVSSCLSLFHKEVDHLIHVCGLDLCVEDGGMRDLVSFYGSEQPAILVSLWFGFLFHFFLVVF